MFSPVLEGFLLFIPQAGVPQGVYVPPDKSYRISPPISWKIIPIDDGGVEFLSHRADQGYWPGMFISREPAQGSQPKKDEISALAAQDRQGFRFVSGELLDLPFGKAYLATYEHTFGKLGMRTAEAHFVQNEVRYWVPFNALAATFDEHFPTYLNCLKSFAPQGLSTNQVN